MGAARLDQDICSCVRCQAFIVRPTSSERYWYVSIFPSLGLCPDCLCAITVTAANAYMGARLEQILASANPEVTA